VISEHARVAERGALLEPPADLTDEAIDIDRQPPLARTRAGRPGALEALGQQPVELAHVPEGKRTKESAKRRRRRQPAPQQPPRAPRAQQSTVVDRVATQHHRIDQRHHLAARVARARALRAQPHQPLRQRLNPKPPGQARHEHHTGITDHTLIIETDPQSIQSDRLAILHHEGDLLTQAPAARYSRFLPAQEVILRPPPDGTDLPDRWIEAKPITPKARSARKAARARRPTDTPEPGPPNIQRHSGVYPREVVKGVLGIRCLGGEWCHLGAWSALSWIDVKEVRAVQLELRTYGRRGG